jgi:hypothetical protein
MRLVIVESPYAARKGHWPAWWDRWQNIRYARRCVRDCVMRGESPIASHLLLTQRGILRDGVATERLKGIKAGYAWMCKADCVVFYTDRGISDGMKAALLKARELGIPYEQRWLDRGLENNPNRV